MTGGGHFTAEWTHTAKGKSATYTFKFARAK